MYVFLCWGYLRTCFHYLWEFLEGIPSEVVNQGILFEQPSISLFSQKIYLFIKIIMLFFVLFSA